MYENLFKVLLIMKVLLFSAVLLIFAGFIQERKNNQIVIINIGHLNRS